MRRVSLISERINEYRLIYSLLNVGPGYNGVDPYVINDMTNVGRNSQQTGANHLQQVADGSWEFTPERHAMHEQIINRMLNQDSQGNPVQRQRSANPTYTFLGGGPGAGKSTMLNAGVTNGMTGENPVVVAADEMKEHIPEYQQMVKQGNPMAGPLAHMESVHLANRLQEAAFQGGHDIISDGTGDGSAQTMSDRIKQARDHGYGVNGFYATIPTEMAHQRAAHRLAQTGRGVPSSVISGIHSSVSKILPQISHQFDNLHLYDTSTPKIKPLYSQTQGKETVHDPAGYQQFLNKANEV